MPVVWPTDVEGRAGFRVWLRYADGSEGEVDLSDLAGQGVFEAWTDAAVFEAVVITPHGSIAWSDAIELCPDALYLELTGTSVEELMPGLSGPDDS
ncbi:MAG: DUF2442 domain-containing protein [Chloroflexi bacterium]|nr:DUF2442 domain-containing protein [Chloroflexota bacterium]